MSRSIRVLLALILGVSFAVALGASAYADTGPGTQGCTDASGRVTAEQAALAQATQALNALPANTPANTLSAAQSLVAGDQATLSALQAAQATACGSVTPTTTPTPVPGGGPGDFCQFHPERCGSDCGFNNVRCNNCGFNNGFCGNNCGGINVRCGNQCGINPGLCGNQCGFNNNLCGNNCGFNNGLCGNNCGIDNNCGNPPTTIRIAPGDCKVLINNQQGYYNGYRGAVDGWNNYAHQFYGLPTLSDEQRLELTQRRNDYLRYQGLWDQGQQQLTTVCNNQTVTPPIVQYLPAPAPPAYQAPPPPPPAPSSSGGQVYHVPSGSVETGDGSTVR